RWLSRQLRASRADCGAREATVDQPAGRVVDSRRLRDSARAARSFAGAVSKVQKSREPESKPAASGLKVPFFRPSIGEAEIEEVATCLRSGWLTTGPTTRRFETDFAAAVGAKHAVAVNSATAALHLAVEALG